MYQEHIPNEIAHECRHHTPQNGKIINEPISLSAADAGVKNGKHGRYPISERNKRMAEDQESSQDLKKTGSDSK